MWRRIKRMVQSQKGIGEGMSKSTLIIGGIAVVLLVVLIVAVVGVGGVLLLVLSQNQSQPTGTTGLTVFEESLDIVQPVGPETCPYECCVGNEAYFDKLCSGNKDCVNNQCVTRPCPYECCDSGNYDFKGCTEGKTCITNTCVATDCPYECCDGTTYKFKSCAYNKECINNSCVKKACPYECCDGSIYQPKGCSQRYECVNNSCEEIKVVDLQILIDECAHSYDILALAGEVTDVYITINNFGNDGARNLNITATASDEGRDLGKSRLNTNLFPKNYELKTKLTLDTQSGQKTSVTVRGNCSNCDLIIEVSTDDCHQDIKYLGGRVAEYLPIDLALDTLDAISPFN